jgi:hypothetical protein
MAARRKKGNKKKRKSEKTGGAFWPEAKMGRLKATAK